MPNLLSKLQKGDQAMLDASAHDSVFSDDKTP